MIARDILEPRPFKDLRFNPFAAAGDDIIDIGPLETLSNYYNAVEKVGLKPSNDKWGIYAFGGPYCEVMLRFIPGETLFHLDVHKEDCVYVDSIRTRLLSKENKPGRGDLDRNPIFGKIASLKKEISWVPEYYLGYKNRAILLAIRNFSNYIREEGRVSVHLFLPKHMAGLGLKPEPHELEFIFPLLPTWLRRALKATYVGHTNSLYARALSQWGEAKLHLRGLEKEPLDLNPIFLLLQESLPCLGVNDAYNLLKEELGIGLPSEYPRFWEKLRFCTQHGYINLRDAMAQQSLPPFWDRTVHVLKSWPNRSFRERSTIIQTFFEKQDLKEELTLEEFQSLNFDDVNFETPLLIKEELAILIEENQGDFNAVRLQLSNRGVGASVSLNIANKQMAKPSLEIFDKIALREPEPSST